MAAFNILGETDVDYSHFLSRLSDQVLRKRLWGLFLKAESEAKEFSSADNEWIDIKCACDVPKTEKGKWIPKPDDDHTDYAQVKIPVDENNLGPILHEVFHSAFHHSPLWKNTYNRCWGEGFCDAFRFFMESRLLGSTDSGFCEKVESYFDKAAAEIIRSNCDEAKYQGRAAIILRKCSKDYEVFKELWSDRNEQSQVLLCQYFTAADCTGK